MGRAMDMIGATRTAGGGGADADLTAVAFAGGDSGTVRNSSPQSKTTLYAVSAQYATAGAQFRVRSPLMHDNSRGISLQPGETPLVFGLPAGAEQLLNPQDTLIVEALSNAASEVVALALHIYYEDLPGAAARLYHPGDILPLIRNIKPMKVACSEAAAGTWDDTVITTTEDLLKANRDYAVLGFMTDRAATAIALKGPDTGNLRVGGPGDVRSYAVNDYFVRLSEEYSRAMIPVFNSANKGATYISLLARTTGGTANVTLILGELERNLN
jgi:hypothetical protein